MHILLSRTAQIYLELHFFVELQSKKSLVYAKRCSASGRRSRRSLRSLTVRVRLSICRAISSNDWASSTAAWDPPPRDNNSLPPHSATPPTSAVASFSKPTATSSNEAGGDLCSCRRGPVEGSAGPGGSWLRPPPPWTWRWRWTWDFDDEASAGTKKRRNLSACRRCSDHLDPL